MSQSESIFSGFYRHRSTLSDQAWFDNVCDWPVEAAFAAVWVGSKNSVSKSSWPVDAWSKLLEDLFIRSLDILLPLQISSWRNHSISLINSSILFSQKHFQVSCNKNTSNKAKIVEKAPNFLIFFTWVYDVLQETLTFVNCKDKLYWVLWTMDTSLIAIGALPAQEVLIFKLSLWANHF